MAKNLIKMHIKCRNSVYPLSKIQRFNVPDDLVSFKTEYPSYSPIFYESNVLSGKPWADLNYNHLNFNPQWNKLESNVNRISYCGLYEIYDNRPLNPFGRTGITGRGILGRWGPNHAADPIVTRWKRNVQGDRVKNSITAKSILQMCAIERHDCHEWAIPGGMVDPGEIVSATLKREFMEEALSTSDESSELISNFFNSGTEIYRGYVDDPRNTDNAWMETVAVNFHDETGERVGKFELNAGDDAAKVKWMDIDRNVKLYASHSDMIREVVRLLDAHW